MKVLAFINNKGGVGKTTSVQNVGAYIAKTGKRVLLIDADSQASLTRSFGVALDKLSFNTGDFILGDVKFENAVLKSDSQVDLLPSTKSLRDGERVIAGKNMYHNKLKKALSNIDTSYDYCLIDCPPALGALTTNALYACDYYFVPLQAEFLSFEGLAQLLEFTQEIEEENGCRLGGVFPTRYNPKIKKILSQELIGSAAEQLADEFLSDCYIRENIALSEAQAMGKSIFEYKPESNGAHDYQKLTEIILKRTNSI